MSDTKDTNPKDRVASSRMPFDLFPHTARIAANLAFLEGALKYGRYNWRVAGAQASVYYNSVNRHLEKWFAGEWSDPKTKIPHLGSAIAGLAVLLDAHHFGVLTDDRPPTDFEQTPSEDYEDLEKSVKHLQEMFKSYSPHQYTINDPIHPSATNNANRVNPSVTISNCSAKSSADPTW
jgi:hypothetical protein